MAPLILCFVSSLPTLTKLITVQYYFNSLNLIGGHAADVNADDANAAAAAATYAFSVFRSHKLPLYSQ